MAYWRDREREKRDNYRKIEAMYRKGRKTQDIANELGMLYEDVIAVEQHIYAMDQKRKGNW